MDSTTQKGGGSLFSEMMNLLIPVTLFLGAKGLTYLQNSTQSEEDGIQKCQTSAIKNTKNVKK